MIAQIIFFLFFRGVGQRCRTYLDRYRAPEKQKKKWGWSRIYKQVTPDGVNLEPWDIQNSVSPWVIIIACIAFSASARCEPAGQPAFTREAMLRDLARNVLVPGWQDLAGKCRDLTNSLAILVEKPTQGSLDKSRQDWLTVAQAASRLRSFQAGPIADRDYISTFYYWQVLPDRIQGVLAASNTIDQPFLDELGATTKGLFAIEYLLFESKDTPANGNAKTALLRDAATGTRWQRHAAYVLALAQELERKAGTIANDWTEPGAGGAGQKFVAGGQQTVNLLVNQLAAGVENAADRHLNFVMVLPKPISRQLYRVERSRSGSSLEGVEATLEGAQKIYAGGGGLGLKDALKQVNPAAEKRVTDGFAAAIGATRAIGAPLEQAVSSNRPALENAYEKTHALEILLKVDLASALGVTLTFSSNDGD